jgi:SAM-dependent methyltransferase
MFSTRESLMASPDYANRANPDRALQAELGEWLPPGNKAPDVLDVGCGPLSTVGIVHQDSRVVLTGADPLSEQYMAMLDRIGIQANCRLVGCNGEELVARFGESSFDLVTCVNAMDHSEYPVEVFRQMVAVCRSGGHVYLWHAENEGFHERYLGMHQWNFNHRGGRPRIDDGRKTYDLLDAAPNAILVRHRRIPVRDRHYLEWVFQKQ